MPWYKLPVVGGFGTGAVAQGSCGGCDSAWLLAAGGTEEAGLLRPQCGGVCVEGAAQGGQEADDHVWGPGGRVQEECLVEPMGAEQHRQCIGRTGHHSCPAVDTCLVCREAEASLLHSVAALLVCKNVDRLVPWWCFQQLFLNGQSPRDERSWPGAKVKAVHELEALRCCSLLLIGMPCVRHGSHIRCSVCGMGLTSDASTSQQLRCFKSVKDTANTTPRVLGLASMHSQMSTSWGQEHMTGLSASCPKGVPVQGRSGN